MTGLTLVLAGSALLVVAALVDLVSEARGYARVALITAALAIACGSAVVLPSGSGTVALWSLGPSTVWFHLDAASCWLGIPGWVMFGVAAATMRDMRRGVAAGFALTALGALGVFGVTNAVALLVAWEMMSLGGGILLLAHHRDAKRARSIFTMLALLEVGSVGLLLGLIVLGPFTNFDQFPAAVVSHSAAVLVGTGLLFLVGFGAKLGLGPFYEWFPGAYAAGSGASGVVLSGVVLNAAYFALGRALLHWLPTTADTALLGTLVTLAGVVTAVLAGLFAFVQGDWRRLLGLSTAENAGIAVTALGASLVFRADHLVALAGLAWLAGMLHLMSHAITKGTLFEVADVVAGSRTVGRYRISARFGPRLAGPASFGAVIAAMSLAAMPPTIGFVSEWLILETLFHDFTLGVTGLRVVLVIAGAGVALAAALALASAVKVVGIGLQGLRPPLTAGARGWVCAGLGVAILAMAGSAIAWIPLMGHAVWFDPEVAALVVHGWLITPLSTGFAFISPAMLETIGLAFVLLPLGAYLVARSRSGFRRVTTWDGGNTDVLPTATTTALTLSNAARTFFSFAYRPERTTDRVTSPDGGEVMVLVHATNERPVFAHALSRSLLGSIHRLSKWARQLQQGREARYLALIGLTLLAILASVFFVR